MKKFEILEHKADLKIKAFGKTKEELFLNMLAGMVQSQKAEIEKEGKIKRKIRIKSPEAETLLVDFLSEVLYRSQTNMEVYDSANFEKFSDTEIEGTIEGKKVRRFGEDIKAVTYHNLDINRKDNGNWEATVLFDI